MFENLKSLFVTIEEEPEVVSTSNVTSTEKKAPEPTKSSSPEPTQNANTYIKDEAIEAKLFKALEDNNQPGFDYFEYKRSLKSLEKLPMDEATKYQSAFATAATMDVTLDKLVGSVEFYKKVLKQEETNFLKSSKEQYQLNVENKKSDIERITNLIKEKSQKIQILTEEIREHQKTQEDLTSFISNADTKIKATENSFNLALNDLLSALENDIIKLKQYIK
jgi:archaellum component FlaC